VEVIKEEELVESWALVAHTYNLGAWEAKIRMITV
jgi:hypothetical protein